MPVIPARLTFRGGMPTPRDIAAHLLSGRTLLEDTADHLLEVVGVLESYGEVLDAYSINLIYQAESSSSTRFRSSNTSTGIQALAGSGDTSTTTESTSSTPSTA